MQSIKNPLVSVLMSCYNSNPIFLKEAIQSVLNQTYANFEFIIINDGQSQTDIKQIIESFNDNRITYQDNEGNKGVCFSYNKLVSISKGKYFTFMDHDDTIPVDRLEVCVRELENDPTLDFVSGRLHFFGNVKERDDGIPMLPEQVSKELYFYQPIKNATAMYRKTSWEKNNMHFNEVVKVAHDYEMWSRTKGMKHLIINKILLNYRKHTTNATVLNRAIIREDTAMIIKRNLSEINIDVPLDLCSLLDKYGFPAISTSRKKELIDLFISLKSKLIPAIGVGLFERKVKEMRLK